MIFGVFTELSNYYHRHRVLFVFGHMVCGVLVPQGIELLPPSLEA